MKKGIKIVGIFLLILIGIFIFFISYKGQITQKKYEKELDECLYNYCLKDGNYRFLVYFDCKDNNKNNYIKTYISNTDEIETDRSIISLIYLLKKNYKMKNIDGIEFYINNTDNKNLCKLYITKDNIYNTDWEKEVKNETQYNKFEITTNE